MKAIVGLGNPGRDYARTRHNLGFLVVDALAERARISLDQDECGALVGRGEVAGVAVLLAKPCTFMNRSGDAVACLVSTRALEPADVLVIVDDLALPLGTIRLRRRGRAGGHNGLKSVIEALGTTDFPRLRLGIKPEYPIEDTVAFVLSEFEEHERPLIEAMIARAIEALMVFLREGVDAAMSRFNSRAPEAAAAVKRRERDGRSDRPLDPSLLAREDGLSGCFDSLAVGQRENIRKEGNIA